MRAIVTVLLFQGMALHWGSPFPPFWRLLKARFLSCAGLGRCGCPRALGCVEPRWWHGGGDSGYRWELRPKDMNDLLRVLLHLIRTPALFLFLTQTLQRSLNHLIWAPTMCEALANWELCISVISYFFIYVNFKTSIIPVFCPACFKKCTFTKAV